MYVLQAFPPLLSVAMTEECDSHVLYGRLVWDLPLVEQLRALAGCLPCDSLSVGQIEPGSPVAKLLNQVADVLEAAMVRPSNDALDRVVAEAEAWLRDPATPPERHVENLLTVVRWFRQGATG